MGETRPARSRVTLTDISSRAWEHPADRGALVAARKLKGFDKLLSTMSGLVSERALRLTLLGSSVRVDERQFPRLHRALADVGAALDAHELPELFVRGSSERSAYTIGLDRPVIVLDSGLVDLLDDDELTFVVGHELGHALSGHAVYHTMLLRLIELSTMLASIPVGGMAFRLVTGALLEWSRKSELSADRAGLLATQDPGVAFRTQMKLASGGHLGDLDQTSFFAQGREFDEAQGVRDSVLKLMLVQGQSHPFPVSRASELRHWVDAGDYTRILSGHYPRRQDDAGAPVSDAAQEAARSYQQSFRDGRELLSKWVGDATGAVGSARGWLDEQVRRRLPGD